MQSEIELAIDYVKIGQRIKRARIEKGFSQAQLGEMIGCSNNHMSHVEVGQTKASLGILIKLSRVLNKRIEYFLMDNPSVDCKAMISTE